MVKSYSWVGGCLLRVAHAHFTVTPNPQDLGFGFGDWRLGLDNKLAVDFDKPFNYVK